MRSRSFVALEEHRVNKLGPLEQILHAQLFLVVEAVDMGLETTMLQHDEQNFGQALGCSKFGEDFARGSCHRWQRGGVWLLLVVVMMVSVAFRLLLVKMHVKLK